MPNGFNPVRIENSIVNHPFISTTITTKPFLQPFITILKLREKCFTTIRKHCFSTCEFPRYLFTLCPGMSSRNPMPPNSTVDNVVQGNGFIELSPFSLKFLPQPIILPVILT